MVFPVVMNGYESWTVKKVGPLELMFLNCDVREDSWESLRLQRDPTSQSHQSWIFIGRTDAEAEAPILWPPDVKNWLILKRLCCWERLKARGERKWKRMMWLDGITNFDGHEFEQALGVGAGESTWCTVDYGVTQSCTQLSDWTGLIQNFFMSIEKILTIQFQINRKIKAITSLLI